MILALDTEDDSQGTVKIINFFDGIKHTTFTSPTLKVDAWDWLNKQAPATVWATQLEYDLINLFGSEWLGKLITLQYVGAGLMRGFLKESKVTFFDTLRHWQYSVKQMGKFLNISKLEMPHLGCACDKCIEYCRRDSEITWRFVEEMLFRYEVLGLRIKATLPSMAMQLFKKFYGDNFTEFSDDILQKFKAGYYGGRVELYQQGRATGIINHYDFNSLFPSVMVECRYPNLRKWRLTKTPNFDNEGLFQGMVSLPYTYFPCLPVRNDTEILFPFGSFEGSWTYPEIRQCLADGGKVKVIECIEFEEVTKPFNEYVNFCYGRRLQSATDLDSIMWKLMLNSLYGKFGQLEGITSIHQDRGSGEVVEAVIGGKSKQSNVIWSAYVTAHARLKLLVALRNCSKVYYTDTDSIFTPDVLPVSIELGALKLEDSLNGDETEIYFKGNKLYIYGDKARAKGIKPDLAREYIHTGRAIYRKPARFRESRRSFAKANVWYDVEKRQNKEYTKRKVLSDGRTEPWHYLEYLKLYG